MFNQILDFFGTSNEIYNDFNVLRDCAYDLGDKEAIIALNKEFTELDASILVKHIRAIQKLAILQNRRDIIERMEFSGLIYG